jgi:hypothetical protein
MNTRPVISAILVVLMLVFAACSNSSEPLPLDNEEALMAALEGINMELGKVGSQMKGQYSPEAFKRSPSLVRDLYAKAFENAGYSYSATLHQLAEEGFDVVLNPTRYTAAAFMLAAVLGGSDFKTEEVFSGQELKDVKDIIGFMGG